MTIRSLPFILTFAILAVRAETARAGLYVNLIVNGDAEAGAGSSTGNDLVPIPGWTRSGNFTVVKYDTPGGFPLSTSPGPPSRGGNLFAGGPSNAASSATQVIDESADAALIDTGGIGFTLSGFFGGYLSQGDYATLTARFLNASNAAIGSALIGGVSPSDRSNATGLLFRSGTGLVPAGTRFIQVRLDMTRLAGEYNDGYADNLSLVLAPVASVPEPSTLVVAGVGLALVGLHRARRSARRR